MKEVIANYPIEKVRKLCFDSTAMLVYKNGEVTPDDYTITSLRKLVFRNTASKILPGIRATKAPIIVRRVGRNTFQVHGALRRTENISLLLINAKGMVVDRLDYQAHQAGLFQYTWRTTHHLAAGIYTFCVRTEEESVQKKVLLFH